MTTPTKTSAPAAKAPAKKAAVPVSGKPTKITWKNDGEKDGKGQVIPPHVQRWAATTALVPRGDR